MSILIIYFYLLFGIFLFRTNRFPEYEELYIFALCFASFKVVTNYRACSVAYAECKLRKVKRNKSYVNQFLDPIIDVRYSNHIFIVLPLTLMIFYYYFITKGQLKEFHQKIFNYNQP